MKNKQNTYVAALASICLASCLQTGAGREGPTANVNQEPILASSSGDPGATWSAQVFLERTELDELEIRDAGFVDQVLKDEKRTRSGMEVSYGVQALRGALRVYADEFLGEDSSTGFSIGMSGSIPVREWDFGPHGTVLRFKYGLSAGITGQEGARIAGLSGDLVYMTTHSELGLALDMNTGLVASLGVIGQSLRGSIEFDGETDHDWGDDDAQGDYTSGYLGMDYQRAGSAWNVSGRALIGDLTGAHISLGWGF